MGNLGTCPGALRHRGALRDLVLYTTTQNLVKSGEMGAKCELTLRVSGNVQIQLCTCIDETLTHTEM